MENKRPKTINLAEYQAMIRRRKVELGLPEVDTEERTESLRNKGLNRTPEKVEQLKAIRDRCRAAGVEPFKASFREDEEEGKA